MGTCNELAKINSVKVVNVIEIKVTRGTGNNQNDVCREVTQYWTVDGSFIIEIDPTKKLPI